MPSPALWAAPTFLFVRGLSLSRPPAPRKAEGTLTRKARAAGVKSSRDPTFLLPSLLPLEAGCKSTAHGVAQPLALWEEDGGGAGLETLCPTNWMLGALGSSNSMLSDSR